MIKKKECLVCASALAMGLFAQVVQQPDGKWRAVAINP